MMFLRTLVSLGACLSLNVGLAHDLRQAIAADSSCASSSRAASPIW
jgi:hypothetical protein